MKVLKQYGLKRSGTNFLKALLMENFDCVVLGFVGGNKHMEIDFTFESNFDDVETNVDIKTLENYGDLLQCDPNLIGIYKNPFAWITSYRNAYFKGKPITDEDIEVLMQLYNRMNKHWSKHCYMVDYHSLIADPFSELLRIQRTFDLTAKKLVTGFDKATGRVSEVFGEKMFLKRKFNPDYYKNKEYMEYLSVKQVKIIQHLDEFYSLQGHGWD